MADSQTGSAPQHRPLRHLRNRHGSALLAIAIPAALWLEAARPISPAAAQGARYDPSRATTSRAARQGAVQSIPFEKLDPQARAKVNSVLSHVSVFRRMPVQVVDCDPDLYLFLVRHPHVVVNIWEVLDITSVKLRQVGPTTFRVAESGGTLATVEFLYSSYDTQVVYAEGSYGGPLLARPVEGRCLMVLKTGYVRETNGRYYITTRLDTFLRVESGGAELLTKTFHPLMGKTADTNFQQSVAFLSSLSRTAEVNSRGVQRLAARLTHVQPELRVRLAELAAGIAKKSAQESAAVASAPVRVASRTDPQRKRQ